MKDPIPKHSYGGGNKNFQSRGGAGTNKTGSHGQGSGVPSQEKRKRRFIAGFLTTEMFVSTERNAIY